MRPLRFQTLTAHDVTEPTLKTARLRAFTFLEAAKDPTLSSLLATAGWTAAAAQHGYDMIAAFDAAPIVAPAATKPDVALVAIAACEAWQAGPLVRARAMMQLEYPEQAATVFADFAPAKGMQAALNVTTILARRARMLTDPARKATRKVDREAIALLDKVAGITKEETKRLAKLVEQTHHVEDAPPPVDASAETARLEALRAIYAWLMAWSDIARTVITRRDYLIRLGLAKRRSVPSKSKSKPVATPPATPPAPAVATPTPTPAPAVTSSLDEHGPDSRAA